MMEVCDCMLFNHVHTLPPLDFYLFVFLLLTRFSKSQTSMAWIVLYYILLKPFKLLPSDPKMNEKYDDADLHPRFSFFSVRILPLFSMLSICSVLKLLNVHVVRSDCELTMFIFFLQNWREYEHIHTFFWCGKDLAWNLDIMPMWILFFIPTLLIGFDFMWVTYKSKVRN